MSHTRSALAPVEIRGHLLTAPIVQGGMGVGISRWRLASAVAACGGMGTLAAQGLGRTSTLPGAAELIQLRKHQDPHGADVVTLETRAAVEAAAGRGLVAVNVMVAVTHYAKLVKAALDGGAQAIVSGAGLPFDLPAIVAAHGARDVALIPIVSSARALKIICRQWQHDHQRLPDAVVLEGPLAGGHLGFKRPELELPEYQLESLLPRVVEEARRWGPFPVIAAGGVWDYGDAQRMLSLGAGAVQLGTRFVITDECDVDPGYKQLLCRTQPEDITIIDSPVGMPARVIRTELIARIEKGQYPNFKCYYQCLESCAADKVRYCITEPAFDAAQGRQGGLFFTGANGWRCREVVTVARLMRELSGD